MNNKDIKQLWNNLTDYAHTYGQEDEVIDIINDFINIPFTRDEYGNYFVKVGDSKTLFVTHLDNAVKQKLHVTKVEYQKDGHDFVKTDGFTILGADDKTGIVMMINMIDNNIPGMYYFFIGEEVGLVGSLLYYKEKPEFFENYERCIAFDRKGYGSIINRMKGRYCCSNAFVGALSGEFAKTGMKFSADPYGVGTDSASFMNIIPECANLSVGYFNEHSYKEEQNIDYMLEMCDALIDIDWEDLPTVRIPKNWDTRKPEATVSQETDLPLYKLQNIFSDICGLFRSKLKAYSSAHSLFEAGKQMRFYQVQDLDKLNNFNVWLYKDGSVKVKKGTKVVKFENYEELFKLLNKNNKKVRKVFDIVKLPAEIEADEKREKLKKEVQANAKEEVEKNLEKDVIIKERVISSFLKFKKK